MLIVALLLSLEIQTLLVAACISLPKKENLIPFECPANRKGQNLNLL
jgi:hypothetical protein